jgi:hypothetical protein
MSYTDILSRILDDVNYTKSPYAKKLLGNSGYLRVTVSPAVTTVDYVKSTGNNVASVEYSYTVKPK